MLQVKKLLVGLAFTIYFFVLIYWMFFGFSRTPHENFMYNLVPFSTIQNYFTYYDHFPLKIWIVNIAGNIGVFVPFGILLPLLFSKLTNVIRFTFTFLVGIITLETFQLISKLGSLDVDDVILNTVGALVGFFIFKLFIKR
ncbi:VanZ family protein [Ferdinandcohnia quinoae]|uniref:VanZ family protein n=1 Tax=Fredinandcohnia quinoae TaxID=2918902 RepID=A0AAW5EBC3_9BACI|nr:VanZ family protein [Fredinandcohnia sp. SECRCQ15]